LELVAQHRCGGVLERFGFPWPNPPLIRRAEDLVEG
jgi:hypothetical protein